MRPGGVHPGCSGDLMAGGAEKKRERQNREKLASLRLVALGAFALHLSLALALACFVESRALARRKSSLALLLTTSVVQFVALRLLTGAAEAGGHLSGLGPRGRSAMAEYAEDAVYLCAGAQALGLLSPWGWALLLAAPGYGAYKGGQHLMRYVFTPTAEEREAQRAETPEERRRREKAERKTGRVKYARG